MAHEIANNDVFFELNKDEKAWHGLGTRIDSISPDFLRASGFVFPVVQEPLFLADGTEVSEAKVNRRTDTGAILAVIGKETHAPDNGYTHLIDWASPLVDSGAVEIATAGTLRGGKRAYISMRFLTDTLQADVAPGDVITSFLMAKDVLDGSGSALVGLCNTRTVCANTLAIAEKEMEKFGRVRFSHTKTYTSTMESFRDSVNVAKRNFEMSMDQYRALACRDINQADLHKYVALCLDVPETTLPKENKALAKILENFNRAEVASTDGTWFKAYNSAQAYLQWQQGTKNTAQVARTNNMLFGPGAGQNRQFLTLALQQSGVSV